MILQVDHICKHFGQHAVLTDISFGLDAGQALAITGSNGAGKTTLLRIITHLLPPDSGEVRFEGHPLGPADLRHIGYLPEERGLYPRMGVREQALYFARLKGMTRHDATQAVEHWLDRLQLADRATQPAAHLSKGMQQRLQLLVAIVHHPHLLILDEPFSGFDATNTERLRQLVQELLDQGTALLLSTHRTDIAATLCQNTLCL